MLLGCEKNGTSLNEQNPERGIETPDNADLHDPAQGLNEQNPERGIETG